MLTDGLVLLGGI